MYQGLTSAEVKARVNQGKVNISDANGKTKSVRQIILSNCLTFFNLLNLGFFILILSVGSYKNALFMVTIVVNTIIGIVQELRTKKTLDALAILTTSHVYVIRNGQKEKIPVEELVQDDVMLLKAGDQIAADALVLEGELEVNESMLTGESDSIVKKQGASVYSGAFVTSGSAVVRVVHVGAENYVETITGEAKKFGRYPSQLRKYLVKILKIISIIIVPLVGGLFCKMYFFKKLPFRQCIEQMVTSGIGMIPEGLVLLTSLALTLGVLRLAKQRTIVQELYCIETLARVDVLCLDKTGTLTEGKIRVEKTKAFTSDEELDEAFRNILATQEDSLNATSEGLFEFFGEPNQNWTLKNTIPFSSERKYSGAGFTEQGTYYIGAQQILLPHDGGLREEIAPYLEDGYRVIVMAHSRMNTAGTALPPDLKAVGYVVMSDVIRKDCTETLEFFKMQGVDLKVISGDDPVTVSMIAAKCGFENADKYIDVSKIKTEKQMADAMRKYSVFGRVKPNQKKLMVKCLQQDGHTVAMTGDGVNDVLAMKQADCSIAMAAGSEAAKHAANIVLLDSDFASMPSIVKEGRRVINNISNASAMYLIKTTFSVLLTIGTLAVGQTYPFQAVQLAIISGCAVGIPTFFLQLEPSFKKIKNNFMQNIFRNAFPPGITIAIVCLLITNIGLLLDESIAGMLSTICVLCIGWIYFYMLKRIYSPMTPFRKAVAYTMEAAYLVVMILGQKILDFTSISVTGVLILIGVITMAPIVIDLLTDAFDRLIRQHEKRRKKKNAKKQEVQEREAA